MAELEFGLLGLTDAESTRRLCREPRPNRWGIGSAPESAASPFAIEGAYRPRWLRDAGYRRVVTAILPENTAGFGLSEKLGYRRVGTAYGIGPGPLRLVRLVRRTPATRSAELIGNR